MHLQQASASSTQAPAATDRWTGIALVAGLAVLVYLNSLGNRFALDDVVIMVDNPSLHSLSGSWKLLVMPYSPGPEALDRGLYRPLTSFAFAVQWTLGNGRPLLFHVVNVTLHAGVTVLVFLLLRSLPGRPSAIAGALVFAVHPVHVEAVANVVGQAELWSALLVLSAALVHQSRGTRGLTARRGAAIVGLYLGAMLFKEHAIVLPGLLLILDLGAGRLRSRQDRRQWLLLGLALAGVAAPYLVLRWIVLGGTISGRAAMELPFLLEPGTRIRSALSVWPQYARLMAFPIDLSAAYDPGTLLPQESLSGAVVLGALLLVLGFLAMLSPRTWPGWGLGFAWFLVAILPVSNLILPVGTLLGERTLYLPSVASAFWVAFAIARVRGLGHAPVRRLTATALMVVLAACSWRVVTRNPVWKDNPTLFRVMLQDHPENFRAHWFRALELAAAGDHDLSAESWHRARLIYGRHSTFLTQYAAFQRSRGDADEARQLITEALRLRPNSPTALLIRGLTDLDLGHPGSAEGAAKELEALGFPGLASQLMDSLAARGRVSGPRDES